MVQVLYRTLVILVYQHWRREPFFKSFRVGPVRKFLVFATNGVPLAEYVIGPKVGFRTKNNGYIHVDKRTCIMGSTSKTLSENPKVRWGALISLLLFLL